MYADIDKDILGKGAYGKVYRGYYVPIPGQKLEENYVAIKITQLPKTFHDEEEKDLVQVVRQEIITLMLLHHPNIVRLLDVKRKGKQIYMILEYCNQGDLMAFLANKQFTEIEIRYFFSQILEAFKYIRNKMTRLNRQGFMHRDIKPQNILINNGQLKVADFGFAQEVESDQLQFESFRGTAITVAPQVIDRKYTDKCDIWSLGCTLYWMIYREFLFVEKNQRFNFIKLVEAQQKLQTQPPDFPETPQISNELKDCIIQMLRYNEKDRINWDNLFELPIYNQKMLIEVGNLNVINIIDYDNLEQVDDLQEQQKIKDFVENQLNLKPINLNQDQIDKVQTEAEQYIKKVDEKMKRDLINIKMLSRLTFEKGRASFLRTVYKKLKDYSLSGRVLFDKNKYEIEDFLTLIKFGLNKFELIILNELIQNLSSIDNNQFGLTPEEWKLYRQDNEDYEKMLKALRKESEILKKIVFDLSYQSANKLKLDNIFQQAPTEYLKQDFSISEVFFVTFYNCIIKLINLLMPEIEKYKEKSNTFMRIRDTVLVVDDLLIILNIEKVFIWDEQQPINYNSFFEYRNKLFSDTRLFKDTYDRVLKIIQIFIKPSSLILEKKKL